MATIVDVAGTLAILSKDPSRPGVSVDINCSYIKSIKSTDSIKIVGKVIQLGKTLAFTQVDIYRKSDGQQR